MKGFYRAAADVTTSDTAQNLFRALYVPGGAAATTVVVHPQENADGENVTFTVPINQVIVIEIAVDLVLATGTDATGIVGFS